MPLNFEVTPPELAEALIVLAFEHLNSVDLGADRADRVLKMRVEDPQLGHDVLTMRDGNWSIGIGRIPYSSQFNFTSKLHLPGSTFLVEVIDGTASASEMIVREEPRGSTQHIFGGRRLTAGEQRLIQDQSIRAIKYQSPEEQFYLWHFMESVALIGQSKAEFAGGREVEGGAELGFVIDGANWLLVLADDRTNEGLYRFAGDGPAAGAAFPPGSFGAINSWFGEVKAHDSKLEGGMGRTGSQLEQQAIAAAVECLANLALGKLQTDFPLSGIGDNGQSSFKGEVPATHPLISALLRRKYASDGRGPRRVETVEPSRYL